MPRSIINHLRSRGGALDFADTETLLAERDAEWDVSEVPQIYYNKVEKAIKGLNRAGIVSDLNKRRDMALHYLKASGEFDAAVREWEQKPAASKTWTTSSLSLQQSTQEKITGTNSPPNSTRQTQWKNRQRQLKNSLQISQKATLSKWRSLSRTQQKQ
jgi:hypothetical protein